MILTGFDLYQFSVPFVAPLPLQDIVLTKRKGWLVRLESDTGAIGWGEASPLPGFSRETMDEVRCQLVSWRERLVGRTLSDEWIAIDGALARELDAGDLAASVRFGLELAVWNLFATTRRVSLARLIAARPRKTVSQNGLLLGSIGDVLEGASRMRVAGFRAVKLKVGRRSLDEDIQRVRSVRDALGPSVMLRLDANRAWRLEEALFFAERLEDLSPEYLEEPLADPAQLPAFAAQSPMPVALDESLVGMAPDTLARHAYARALILKPTLLGGIVPTLRLARRGQALGMTLVLSAAFETGIGMRGVIALAACIGSHAVPAGLDTYRHLAVDVLHPRLDCERATVGVSVLMEAARSINWSHVRPT